MSAATGLKTGSKSTSFSYEDNTRLVILTKNYAIKIPKPSVWNNFLRGLLASMEERLIWRVASIEASVMADCKMHLCPVVWASWGGWILIMRRCMPSDPENWRRIEILNKVCSDHKASNYGMLDGRLVMFDYGETMRRYTTFKK